VLPLALVLVRLPAMLSLPYELLAPLTLALLIVCMAADHVVTAGRHRCHLLIIDSCHMATCQPMDAVITATPPRVINDQHSILRTIGGGSKCSV